ncbi:hypothetical protein BSKO_09639 [Bryopsis sp. KO-2023]|nr:hypothetical protein BSKO_09639 [Bryopsis sp. KO-2023]
MPRPPLNPGAEACLIKHEIRTLEGRFHRLQAEFSSTRTLVNAFTERVERFLRAKPIPTPKKRRRTPSKIRVWLSVACCLPFPLDEDDDETDWLLGTEEQRAAPPPSFASSASSQAAVSPDAPSTSPPPPPAGPSDHLADQDD